MGKATGSNVLLVDFSGTGNTGFAFASDYALFYNGHCNTDYFGNNCMVTLLFDLLKTARPRQWIKNLTLYAALVFTGYLWTRDVWIRDFWIVSTAIVAFTMVAAAIYFLNDVVDIKADQAHPFKRKRPIAAGRVSKQLALVCFLILASMGLWVAKNLSPLYLAVVMGYFAMQVLYSVWLKNIEVVDVYVVAIGFFLRVLAGAIVINAHLSIWFLLCVVSTSLFLAVGKRRAELAILSEQAAAHRKVMGRYSPDILDSYLSMFATAAFFSWALYTFNFYEQPGLQATTIPLTPLSRTLTINKWLMATIPVVIFGIMRYLRIIYDGSRAESPERVIFSDLPLLMSVAVWGGLVIAVLYWIPG
jgi:4-hydroxybenzoate polyprenyltransferase